MTQRATPAELVEFWRGAGIDRWFTADPAFDFRGVGRPGPGRAAEEVAGELVEEQHQGERALRRHDATGDARRTGGVLARGRNRPLVHRRPGLRRRLPGHLAAMCSLTRIAYSLTRITPLQAARRTAAPAPGA
jgi:hypothetical protein